MSSGVCLLCTGRGWKSQQQGDRYQDSGVFGQLNSPRSKIGYLVDQAVSVM
jgi:hypothetical protein